MRQLISHPYCVTYKSLKILCVTFFLIFATQGCSTASWIVNPPPSVSDLYVTEDDVAAYFDRISETEPSDPDAVLYNPETDRYEVKAPAYKRGLTKTIMYEIQKEKISEFAEDYQRETLGKVLKKDLTMTVVGVILAIVGVVVIGGL